MAKLFSAFDGKDYLNTGLNSKTKSECITDVSEYLFDELYKTQNLQEGEVETLIGTHGITIEEHDGEIEF